MADDLSTHPDQITGSELYLPAHDLKEEMPFFLGKLGFRLDEIFPADDPAVALISGHGVRIRLDRNADVPPGRLRLRCENAAGFADGAQTLLSPAGTVVEIAEARPPLDMPETQHSYLVRHLRDSDSWVIGRAGMRYRDLIPDRLGGSIIASHIRIPDGGPVPDMVHYHVVGFQLIFCYRGWVRLVYEDQGDPFVLEAGCCVIQPPQIRHRVLEASDNVEVLEIGVPAEHVTTIDHELELPNGAVNPDREWQGTRFVHHREAGAHWAAWRIPGWESRDTGIGEATGGVAGVHVARPVAGVDPVWTNHTTDILFTFVKEGTMKLEVTGKDAVALVAGDAFVLPPFLKSRYLDPSPDCELIEVTLPAVFETEAG
jgi:quercetin dioxygenase-like cupin family protein